MISGVHQSCAVFSNKCNESRDRSDVSENEKLRRAVIYAPNAARLRIVVQFYPIFGRTNVSYFISS